MTSYEEVLAQITAIPNGVDGRDRTIQWLNTSQIVGVARDHLGHVELFLTGLALQARTKTVRDALHHHSWHREDEAPLEANRILLPAFGYYDQVGAFIAAELLREGADRDLPRAFAMTEPIIELSIKRLELSRSALVGLAGELLLLDAVLRHADEQYVGELIQAWDGWRRSSRDSSWNGTGVEIKTTTGRTSSHTVQGIHQIEQLQATDDVIGEDRLLLVSVGLQLSEPSANSFTVPQLTQRITERMETTGNSGAVSDFLAHVASYGSESGFGYHHTTMSNDAPFDTSFTPAFVRSYEMGDPAVEVLRRHDVLSHHHVDAQSVTFKINLPAMISADNPVSGIHRVAAALLGSEPPVR